MLHRLPYVLLLLTLDSCAASSTPLSGRTRDVTASRVPYDTDRRTVIKMLMSRRMRVNTADFNEFHSFVRSNDRLFSAPNVQGLNGRVISISDDNGLPSVGQVDQPVPILDAEEKVEQKVEQKPFCQDQYILGRTRRKILGAESAVFRSESLTSPVPHVAVEESLAEETPRKEEPAGLFGGILNLFFGKASMEEPKLVRAAAEPMPSDRQENANVVVEEEPLPKISITPTDRTALDGALERALRISHELRNIPHSSLDSILDPEYGELAAFSMREEPNEGKHASLEKQPEVTDRTKDVQPAPLCERSARLERMLGSSHQMVNRRHPALEEIYAGAMSMREEPGKAKHAGVEKLPEVSDRRKDIQHAPLCQLSAGLERILGSSHRMVNRRHPALEPIYAGVMCNPHKTSTQASQGYW